MRDGLDMQNLAAVEENFAANVRRYREQIGLSQEDLAQRMTERGFGFSQATVWKIEQGKRAVRIGEAVALAEALGLPAWLHLTRDPRTFEHEARVQAAHYRAAVAFAAIKTATMRFLEAQTEVAYTAHEAREAGVPTNDLWLHWLQIPAERAVIEARVEYDQADEVGMRLSETVTTIMASLREHGFDPTINLDDITVSGPPYDGRRPGSDIA